MRRLGRIATELATARLVSEGMGQVYLKTDDFRLPAIRVYLTMGWEPNLYAPDMAGRWEAIRAKLAQGARA